MIYLILKMFVYLLLALLTGAGAGWVLRHIGASRQEEEMQRTLADARARVPQFESLIRSRDEQINRLKEDLKDKDVRINALLGEIRGGEEALRDRDRQLKQLSAQSQSPDAALTGGDHTSNVLEDADFGLGTTAGEEARTSQQGEVERLRRELADARAQTADATAEAAAAEAEVITLKAALARAGAGTAAIPTRPTADSDSVAVDRDAVAEKLAQKIQETERLGRALELEQRRILELERERELQNKSLQVLHQQLELARERGQRLATG